MSLDVLKKCLAWSELLETGQVQYSRAMDALIEAGLAKRQGRTVVLADHDALAEIVDSQCRDAIRAMDAAHELAGRMGLKVKISAQPFAALRLVQELTQYTTDAPCSFRIQDVSARLFGDSKYIWRVPVLNKIFSEWSKSRYLRGELRLKVYTPLVHAPHGLDLELVTAALGHVCIPARTAARVADFDLRGMDFVLTSENLAPFQAITLERGLMLFCPGYDTGLSGLWLQSLPSRCQWIHFGDFDPDGLHIFEQLCVQAGREGRFVPDIGHMESIKDRLPNWNGAREFDPARYGMETVQELAAWGRAHKVFAEQEEVLHLLSWKELCGLK